RTGVGRAAAGRAEGCVRGALRDERHGLDRRLGALQHQVAHVPHVAVVDPVDRCGAEVAAAPGPDLRRGAQRDDGVAEQRLHRVLRGLLRGGGGRRHSLTAPSLVFMMRRWNTKNTTATGTVMIAAAASLSGYWLPWLSCPLARDATPLVRVVSSGDCAETMKWLSSFHEPWKERITMVTRAGRAMGSTTDQKIRNVPAPSIRACSSTEAGIDSKKFFMMNTPAASTRRGSTMPAYES